EIGIHDLRHEGHLFSSYRGFNRRAERIIRYAREWGVAGFRSGFMLRNLDWLHDLDVQYDASRSTRTHLSRSQTDVTLCFRSGCHAQMTIALLLYNQCVTALQEV